MAQKQFYGRTVTVLNDGSNQYGGEDFGFTSREMLLNGLVKVGATAGWTAGGGAVDTGPMATCAASATAGTLVVPITDLNVGEKITAFKVNAQIESAGGAVTLDAKLMRRDLVAAANTETEVGAITQVAVTADTASEAEKTGLTQVVGDNEAYFLLLTATTAASTDIELMSVTVTIEL